MIIKNATSLKAKIKAIAKDKDISAQVVLQNYFFECFLDRLVKSEYRDNFILKGGLLIATMAGLNARSTMDIDATIRSMVLDEDQIRTVISTICSMPTDDYVSFELSRVSFIRADDEYGGYRVSLNAIFEKINAPLSVDITTGDIITPKPVKRKIESFFDSTKHFELWAYNVETILAEKIETILRRSVLNTRPRDFYDVYLIVKTQKFNKSVFRQALSATSKHRGSFDRIKNIDEILYAVEENSIMKKYWDKYKKEYTYAKDIEFTDTIQAIRRVMNIGAKFV